MPRKLPQYVRTHRLHLGLTQEDLAILLGYANGSKLSQVEHNKRVLTQTALIACLLIFDCTVIDLFPGQAMVIEESVCNRAHERAAVLAALPTVPRKAHRIQALEGIAARLGHRNNL